ncbi:Brix domain-containing protein 1 [Paragonimus heterotremus]|uniref:Ribosome production factor 2 homolog n=1 Tax=Paragonimus heterotremus TaxID=100268 RepID=A0A8J4SGF1_9TREM|nr:Brix domain-containing protein 1 [Paragonimus heterotremus]
MPVSNQVNPPKTHKGKKVLESKAPKIVENDKKTLVLKGGHTSQLVNDFLNDLCSLKNPLVFKLKWRNPVLPFEDISFVEKMCRKYDCSLFVIGLHSKKRPHNIVIGRLHDGELLDMFELGIQHYVGLLQDSPGLSGAKPLLLFSGEAFEEQKKYVMLKSLFVDLFRGPTVEGIRSIGIEHMIQIAMTSEDRILLRVRRVLMRPLEKPSGGSSEELDKQTKPLRTPWGMPVQLSLEDTGPSVDFDLRRVTIPSEDKWKRAHRVPPETRMARKTPKNRHVDVFGSRIGRVHVGKTEKLEILRPGASLRTALTGHRKRGFERRQNSAKVHKSGEASRKHRKLSDGL